MYKIPDSLIQKYAVNGPRYTSYPTFPVWKPIEVSVQREWFQEQQRSTKPISLYFHVPFCKERCTYCGCNTMITNNYSKASDYVQHMLKELDALAEFLQGNRKVRQLHFGGGTPTFLEDHEFSLLINKVKEHFTFEEGFEMAIEVDPCSTRPGQMEFLASLGFNRLSLGVQDFNPKVQEAVNRIQSVEITKEHMDKARVLGFSGVNFDFIYGLPYQTFDSFQVTLSQILELQPDRMALYNFAHLPERFPHQAQIDPNTLAKEREKLDILFSAIQRLTDSGYEYIGMDHFAKQTDELAIALKERRLHRNFMGYSPKSGVDLYGIGVSSIGETDEYFIQNEKRIVPYQQMISSEGLSGTLGLRLSEDDKIRKWTILQLICNFYLPFAAFEQKFGRSFQDYFQSELQSLAPMVDDGLLEIHADHIQIKPYGKILVRNICMKFDAYLEGSQAPQVKFSKTI